ncbi:MAG: OsmC family protein [Acidimicrobiia bacterium]|nr:OsmC family protein [Acidimicrobiia bacterium]
MMTVIDTGEFGLMVTDEPVPHGGTGEGPSPLQAILGALCGCESVTFNRTAAEMDFQYDGIDFEAEFTIDIRGRLGVRGVTQHFQTIRVQATLYTSESEERIRAVVAETEARCPVFNLVSDAGVKLEVLWVHQPSRPAAS